MIKYFWITNPWIRIQQCWNFRTIYVAYEVMNRVVVPASQRLWSPGIDSKASIPPAYVAWRAGTITLFLLGA
jgi:hypothetical protein